MPLLKSIFQSLTVININLRGLVKLQNNMDLLGRNNLHTEVTKCDSATIPSLIPSPKESKERPVFKFTDYDCIGFDLDNTICRFKIGAMAKLEYETMSKFLIEERGYPSKHLLKPFEEHQDFLLKGLIIDAQKGNILRIGTDGKILSGTHGTKPLTQNELIKYYGIECRWHATDLFSENPLHTWNGPITEQMRTLLDYFDLPAGLVFARAVDGLDEETNKTIEKYTIWSDLLDALVNMFQKEHFHLGIGGYFPEMKANPDKYIYKCSDNLINWFLKLKENNKKLFLITGSNVDFASYTASTTMGPNWQQLFDIIVCFAKKPGFFTGDRKFMGLNGFEETGPVEANNLQAGQIYSYGNFNDLHEFLKRHSSNSNPKLLYIGDNLIQDVYTPAVHTVCDTVAVVEELQAEGKLGHPCNHVDHLFIVSSMWGSYFGHPENHTFWNNIIQKHSKLCIPSLEYVASNPIDHSYMLEHV